MVLLCFYELSSSQSDKDDDDDPLLLLVFSFFFSFPFSFFALLSHSLDPLDSLALELVGGVVVEIAFFSSCRFRAAECVAFQFCLNKLKIPALGVEEPDAEDELSDAPLVPPAAAASAASSLLTWWSSFSFKLASW